MASGNLGNGRKDPKYYKGERIPDDELVEGEDNKMWTISFKTFDEKTGQTTNAATEFAKDKLEKSLSGDESGSETEVPD